MKASKSSLKNRFFTLCAILAIGAQLALAGAAPLGATAGGSPQNPVIWDISTGPLVVAEDGSWLVAGRVDETDAFSITVRSGVNCNITLRGAVIDLSPFTRGVFSPITVEAGAHLTLRLEDSSRLGGPAGYPAIHVPEGASLDIHGPGSLTATGGTGGAGIGGGSAGGATGLIGIYSGTIGALGGAGGAGIGGGAGGSAGRVVICGGDITAGSAAGGAGIGGGAGGGGSSVELYGGRVAAFGGPGSEVFGGGAGIGGGSGGDGGAFYLYGASLSATGGGTDPGEEGAGGAGAGIGGGGGAPGGKGFGGSAGSASLCVGPATVQIAGGPVHSGTGGGGAGIGGGGCAGAGGMGGLGGRVEVNNDGPGTLEVQPGEALGTGGAGAAYGDGGSAASADTPRGSKPGSAGAPGAPAIEEIYLNGYLCSPDPGDATYVASLPVQEAGLAEVQLSVVASPGCTITLDGETLVNGLSLLDFYGGEPVALSLETGGETLGFSVLALATGQTYDTAHLENPAQEASSPAEPAAPVPQQEDGPLAGEQLPVVLTAALAGLLLAAVIVGVALARSRKATPED